MPHANLDQLLTEREEPMRLEPEQSRETFANSKDREFPSLTKDQRKRLAKFFETGAVTSVGSPPGGSINKKAPPF